MLHVFQRAVNASAAGELRGPDWFAGWLLTLTTSLVTLIGGLSQPASAQPRGQPPKLSASAVEQMRVLEEEKRSRTPAQRKMSSRLLYAVRAARGTLPQALSSMRVVQAEADGTILVDIQTSGPAVLGTLSSLLGTMDAQTKDVSRNGRFVRARVPLLETETLADQPFVKRVELARRGMTHRDTSEGDIAHRADHARVDFSVDGTGVKICVLANGCDSLGGLQSSEDLPPTCPAGSPCVEILPGQSGLGDEGCAMLEIIHDLAPGANLGFATVVNSYQSFADNIRDLRSDLGCDIIVDDYQYAIESPFQDLEIAEAVNEVTADGALYFSSAGNEGNLNDGTSGTWEGDFDGNGTIPGVFGTVHDFGDGGQSDLVTVGNDPLFPVTLHWTDPFGASGNDYDLIIMDNGLTTIMDVSYDIQDGDDNPFEVTGPALTNERIVVAKYKGSDRMIHVLIVRGQLSLATHGCIHGHNSAAAAFGVAAVDVATAGGNGGHFNGSESVETYSCDGPRRIFFANDGTLLPGAPAGDFSETGGVVRNKTDITAADCVTVATPGFSPFCGTSAAAAHAAAIAGLLLDHGDAPSPEQIRNALTTAAIDIEDPSWDRDSGAGIADALGAVYAVPALNSWGMSLLAGLLLVAGALLARDRRLSKERLGHITFVVPSVRARG